MYTENSGAETNRDAAVAISACRWSEEGAIFRASLESLARVCICS